MIRSKEERVAAQRGVVLWGTGDSYAAVVRATITGLPWSAPAYCVIGHMALALERLVDRELREVQSGTALEPLLRQVLLDPQVLKTRDGAVDLYVLTGGTRNEMGDRRHELVRVRDRYQGRIARCVELHLIDREAWSGPSDSIPTDSELFNLQLLIGTNDVEGFARLETEAALAGYILDTMGALSLAETQGDLWRAIVAQSGAPGPVAALGSARVSGTSLSERLREHLGGAMLDAFFRSQSQRPRSGGSGDPSRPLIASGVVAGIVREGSPWDIEENSAAEQGAPNNGGDAGGSFDAPTSRQDRPPSMTGLAHETERSARAVLLRLEEMVGTIFAEAPTAERFRALLADVEREVTQLLNIATKNTGLARPGAAIHWLQPPAQPAPQTVTVFKERTRATVFGRVVTALGGGAHSLYVALQNAPPEWYAVSVIAVLAALLPLPIWYKTERFPEERLLPSGPPVPDETRRLRGLLAHQRMLQIVLRRWRASMARWDGLLETRLQQEPAPAEPISEAVELIVGELIQRSDADASEMVSGLWSATSPFSFCRPHGYESLTEEALKYVSTMAANLLVQNGSWLHVVRGDASSEGSQRILDWLVRSANPPVMPRGREQGMLVLVPDRLGETAERRLASYHVGRPEFAAGAHDEIWVLRYTAGFESPEHE